LEIQHVIAISRIGDNRRLVNSRSNLGEARVHLGAVQRKKNARICHQSFSGALRKSQKIHHFQSNFVCAVQLFPSTALNRRRK
jgi:hypothetical protein